MLRFKAALAAGGSSLLPRIDKSLASPDVMMWSNWAVVASLVRDSEAPGVQNNQFDNEILVNTFGVGFGTTHTASALLPFNVVLTTLDDLESRDISHFAKWIR